LRTNKDDYRLHDNRLYSMLESMSTNRTIPKGNICGARVKALRKRLGMAQIDLAEALNVDFGYTFDQSDISEIERHFRGIKDHELKALAIILETTADILLA